MPLADCVTATSVEVTDPTLTPGAMSYYGSSIQDNGSILAGLSATWSAVANPYVVGVQFQYGPTDLTATATTTQTIPIGALAWMSTTAIVGGKQYQIRARATGIPPLVGPWSSTTTLNAGDDTAPAPAQPGASAWSATGSGLTANGVTFPALNVAGTMDATGVTAIQFYFRPHGSGTFTPFTSAPPGTVNVIIDSVASGAIYDFGVTYLNGETEGPLRIYDNGGSGYTVSGFAASGVTDDKTPSAIAWADISSTGSGLQTAYSTTQTFAGINVPITLTFNYTNTATWYYSKNGGSWTNFSSGGQITVSVGDTLAFSCQKGTSVTSVLTVVNHTDSDTTLDTITATLTVTGFSVSAGTTDATYTEGTYDDGFFSQTYWFTNLTATVTGGTGPFTYSWAVIDGDVQIAFPTTATPQFDSFSPTTSHVQCTVTDTGAGGATGMTPVITLHI